jgi:hypothetical protein
MAVSDCAASTLLLHSISMAYLELELVPTEEVIGYTLAVLVAFVILDASIAKSERATPNQRQQQFSEKHAMVENHWSVF